jgi:hypothetical protein
MRTVRVTVSSYRRYKNQPIETVDYEINLKPSRAIVKIYTPGIYGKEDRVKRPSIAVIDREDFLYWLLSLNKKERKFLDSKLGNFMMHDFLTIVSYVFEQDFHQRLKTFEKIHAEEPFGIYERMSLTDLENLATLDKEDIENIEVKNWRDLMIRQRPMLFHPHAIYYNPFFYHYKNEDIHKTKLVESSTEDIEQFLNFVCEISHDIIKKYVEKVEIDENRDWQYGYIFLHPKLKQCIKDAYWSREVCLISASDTVRSWLKYDKDCITRLAEELAK